MAEARYKPGDICGSYMIEAVIGSGGMGDVYKASSRYTRQIVALKCLRGRYEGEPDAEQRLSEEAEMLARLDPLMIAAAHGGVIDTLEMIPLLKSGMLMGQLGIEAKITKIPAQAPAGAK